VRREQFKMWHPGKREDAVLMNFRIGVW
jgi:hypothetical protein